MNTYFGIYLLTRLESIIVYLRVFGIFSAILMCVLFLVWLIAEDSETCVNKNYDPHLLSSTRKTIKKIWITLIPVVVLLFGLLVLIPTQKEAIFIVAGGKTLDWAIQDSSLSKLPSQSTQLMSGFLEEQIKSLSKEINNEVDSVKVNLKDGKDSITNKVKKVIN